MTINNIINEFILYKENMLSSTTIFIYKNIYNKYLKDDLDNKDISNISITDLRIALNNIMAKYNVKSLINTIYEVLNLIFEYSINKGYIKNNPIKYIKRPNKVNHYIKPMTSFEIKKFIELSKDDNLKNAFYLIMLTGIRKSECVALYWSDYDNINKTLTINYERKRHFNNKDIELEIKAKRKRTFILSDLAVKVLEDERLVQNMHKIKKRSKWMENNHIFTHLNGQTTTISRFNIHLKNILTKLNRKDDGVMLLRITLSNLISRNGKNIPALINMIGVKSDSQLKNKYLSDK